MTEDQRNNLEPLAKDIPDTTYATRVSIAISLKRIADMMERKTQSGNRC